MMYLQDYYDCRSFNRGTEHVMVVPVMSGWIWFLVYHGSGEGVDMVSRLAWRWWGSGDGTSFTMEVVRGWRWYLVYHGRGRWAGMVPRVPWWWWVGGDGCWCTMVVWRVTHCSCTVAMVGDWLFLYHCGGGDMGYNHSMTGITLRAFEHNFWAPHTHK